MRTQRVLALARQQDGLITRQQALAAGASVDAVRHAINSGRWQIILTGIYATFDGPLAHIHHLRAALLHSGEESMITGVTACKLVGLTYVPPDLGFVDTLVDARRRPSDMGHVRVNRTSRLPKPTWWADTSSPEAARDLDQAAPWWVPGDDLAPTARRWTLPIAPQHRAAIDAVRFHSLSLAKAGPLKPWRTAELLRDTRALLCEVVQRRRCSVADLVAEYDATPRPGTAHIRRALDDVAAGCRSAPECDLRDLVRASRVLPEPMWNQQLPGYGRVLHPDACWPEARLVVEVNSVEWHRFGKAAEATERRHALYAALGWRVFPVSPYRLRHDAAGVRQELVAAYRAAIAAG